MTEVLTLPVQAPYPWKSILGYLSSRCTPGLETISDRRYVRRIPAGIVSVDFDPSTPALRCSFEEASTATSRTQPRIFDALPRLQRLFDTTHDPAPVTRVLERCPVLGPRVRKLPGVRVPGSWEPFELCVRVVLGQQVSVK